MNIYKLNSSRISGEVIIAYSDLNHFFVQVNGVKKAVRIKDDCDCAYKLLKTRINAKGGSKGLYEFIKDCDEKNFMVCLSDKIINHIINNMKYCSN